MFGKGKLLQDGAEARGVVIESIFTASGDGGTVRTYRVKLRVQFDDGSTTEVSGKLNRSEVGSHTEGAILPVRYDPKDHSRIEIDVPALRALTEAQVNDVNARAIARGERRLAASPASTKPSGLDVDDELLELLEFEEAESGAAHTSSAAPASGPEARLARLQQLADLHDRGVLNDNELAAEKAKILSDT